MIDVAKMSAPKSDQLNADDLIGGPRTVTIREVRENNNAEQPLSIFFDGDNGKPYKPCKSMRRVFLAIWGANGLDYVGKSMTLFLDPTVTWGGQEVGGIRISHMTGIDEPFVMALSASAKKRIPYTVEPLVIKQQRTIEQLVDAYIDRLDAIETLEALQEFQSSEGIVKFRETLRNADKPELEEKLIAANSKRAGELSPEPDAGDQDDQNDDGPEDDPFAGTTDEEGPEHG